MNAINPSHYTSHPSGIECKEISKYLSGCLAQAFQYVWRCGQKDEPVQELKKALWFIDTELSMDQYHDPFADNFMANLRKVVLIESNLDKAVALSNIAIANKYDPHKRIEILTLAKAAINQMIEYYAAD